MKVDPLPFHENEGAADDDRDAEGKNDAAPESEGKEGSCHDDDDGFQQRFREIVDGIIDDLRLIGDEADCHAGRDFLLRFFDFRIQMLAKREVVSPISHGNGNADRRFPVKVEEGRFRGRIALRDLGDVA